MYLVALCYPKMTEADKQWAGGILAANDELYGGRVPLHYTLVFPVLESKVPQDHFCRHVRRSLLGTKMIRTICRCAIVNKDAGNEYYHTFLVPEEGFSQLVKVHDKLYQGILAPFLRLDIQFTPHLGIATSKDPLKCKRLADEINGQELRFYANVTAIEVVRFDGQNLETIERVRMLAE